MKKPYISNYVNKSNYINLNFKNSGTSMLTDTIEDSDIDEFNFFSHLTKSLENSDIDE